MVESAHAYLGLDWHDRPVITREVYKKTKAYLGTEEGGDPTIHMVTAGDFAQLSPCFEIFIFSPPVSVKTNAGPSRKDETKLKSSGYRYFF